jgi:hypothetical protein
VAAGAPSKFPVRTLTSKEEALAIHALSAWISTRHRAAAARKSFRFMALALTQASPIIPDTRAGIKSCFVRDLDAGGHHLSAL